MIINNSHAVVLDRKLLYILIVSLIAILSLLFFTNWFIEPVLGICREVYAMVFCSCYVLINVYRFLIDLTYLYFSDEKGKLIFRYYSLRPFMQRYRTIEIPQQAFLKFEISESVFGAKSKLTLYQKNPAGLAKYPPISLSALKKSEKEALILTLSHYVKKK